MQRAVEAQRSGNGLADMPRVGDRAPLFTLANEDGQLLTSAQLLDQGPLVVSFYRGVWCPYCNEDLKALNEVLPRIRAASAQLVAVSPQTPANSRKTRRSARLDFSILTDPGNQVAALFALRFRLDPAVQALYEGFGINLPTINGEDSWTLPPVPARFVLAVDGTVAYAEADPDYTRRPEPEGLLAVLEDLARQHAA